MKVIKPAVFDHTTNLVASNAVELYSTYSAVTSYSKDDYVEYLHEIYISLINSNTGNDPHAAGSTAWLLVGPCNVLAMFDNSVDTATTSTSPLEVTLATGLSTAIAFFGLVGSSMQIVVRDGLAGPIVYDTTFNLDGTILADWYQYYFEAGVQLGELIVQNLPVYPNAHLTFTLTGATDVAVGNCLYGTVYNLGETQYGANSGITDFSVKETDAFGTTTLVRRTFSKRLSANLELPNAQINKVQRVLTDLRATPCAWIGVDDPQYSPLVVFGFYKDFSINVQYFSYSLCSLEIEGLT